MFMPYLKYDDGKLATYIAEKEHWELNDAKNLIAKYVREVLAVLDRGESYEMYGFGTFFKDKNGDFSFSNWDGNLPSERSETIVEESLETEQELTDVTVENSTFEENNVEVEMNDIDLSIENQVEQEVEPTIVFENREIEEDITDKKDLAENSTNQIQSVRISLGPSFELSIENGEIIDLHKKEGKVDNVKIEEISEVQNNQVSEALDKTEPSEELFTENQENELVKEIKEEIKPEVKEESASEILNDEKKEEKREKLERPSRLERPERPNRNEKQEDKKSDNKEEIIPPSVKDKNKKEVEVIEKPKLVVHKTTNQIKSMKLAAIIIGIGIIGGLYLLLFNSDEITTPVEPDKKELAENNKNIQKETKEEVKEETTTTIVEEVETTETPEVEAPVEEPVKVEKEIEKPTKPIVSAPSNSSNAVSGTYHIIAGSFGVNENANTFADKMKEKGFQAQVLGRINNMYIVSIGSYSTKQEAVEANHKNEVKGWIHRKK